MCASVTLSMITRDHAHASKKCVARRRHRGVDDAHALLLALRSPSLKVVGVSCVAGNGPRDLVVEATLKVLRIFLTTKQDLVEATTISTINNDRRRINGGEAGGRRWRSINRSRHHDVL
jgi:hypothetical protein